MTNNGKLSESLLSSKRTFIHENETDDPISRKNYPQSISDQIQRNKRKKILSTFSNLR